MTKLLVFYSFILTSLMATVGFLTAHTVAEILSALLFFPLALYFALIFFPQKSTALVLPKAESSTGRKSRIGKKTDLAKPPSFDPDRRAFLKIIGTAGLTLFLFSVFTKRAHGAFFGSMPGPGTVALKDSQGTVIDPAISTPTDGYKISDIDSSTPAYYGFTNKAGKWFIMKEGTSGDYRYKKGDTSYSTNWTNRTSLTYDYFNVVFA